jgi:hypothetical protein
MQKGNTPQHTVNVVRACLDKQKVKTYIAQHIR